MQTANGAQYFGVGLDLTSLRQGAAEARNLLHGIGQQAASEGSQMDAVFSRMRNTVAGVFAVGSVKEFIMQVVQTRAEIQSLSISFETLLGSKEKAAQMFGDIRKFAVETPMMLKDLAGGAQTMLAFNIEANRVMPMLHAIGDISMGDAQKFNSLTLAFSQMSATGKLMGQDLLQMINAGFNPLAIISEKTGKSIGELKKEMEAGSISSKMVEDAFIDATSAGGKFYGMLEKQSHGLAGAQAKLSGAIDDMFNSMGESAEGTIVATLSGTSKIVENYKTIGEILMVIVASYGAYKGALIALNAVEAVRYQMTLAQMAGLTKMGALTEILTAKTNSLTAAMLANPWGLAAAAVVALGYGIYKLVTYQTDAEKAQERLNKVNDDFNKTCASEQVQIDTLFSRLRNAKKGTEAYKEAKDAILGQYGNYLKGLSAEVSSLQDVEAAYKAVKTAALDAARARAMETALKGEADAYGEVEAEQLKKLENVLKGRYGNQLDKKTGSLLWVENYNKIKGVIQGGGGLANLSQEWLRNWDQKQVVKRDEYGAHYVTTNAIETIFKSIDVARKIYNDAAAEAQKLYGTPNTTAPEEKKPKATEALIRAEIAKEEKKLAQLRKKKATLEEQKEVQDRIEALTKQLKDAGIDINRENRNAVRQENVKEDNKDKLAAQAAQRVKDEQAYSRKIADEAKQREFAIEQARIDAMDEGFQKTLDQNQLNYNRLKQQNEQNERELLDDLAEKMLREEETKNPEQFMKKDSKGKLEDNPGARDARYREIRSVLTVANLPADVQTKLTEQYNKQGEAFNKANQNALEQALADVQSYTQQREKILQDYKRREEELYTTDDSGAKVLRKGVTQGNIDELHRQRDEALASVDNEFASRDAEFESWCNQIANWSLDKLSETLTQAQAQLDAMQKANPADTKLAGARAKVNTLQNTIKKKQADNKVNLDKRAIKDWQTLQSTLNEVVDVFDALGEAVGGTAGEILKGCGSIANTTLTMINSIVGVVNASSAAMQATSLAGAASIKTMESASVILVVISAALQIATQLASMFDSDKAKQEEIKALQERISQLQWELDNVAVLRIQNASEGKNYFDMLCESMRDTYMQTVLNAKAMGDSQKMILLAERNSRKVADWHNKAVDSMTQKLTSLSYSMDKALGEEKYREAREAMNNYASQMVSMMDELETEKSRGKKKDKDRIAELERNINEKGQEAREVLTGLFEDLVGGSAESIANDLADAFFDAFAAGEDAAQAWGDKVHDIVGSVLKRMLVTKLLEQPIGKLMDKYMALWMPGGEMDLNAVQQSLPQMMTQLNGTFTAFDQFVSLLPQQYQQMLKDSMGSREAATQGIATASQESVDELNGRMTAVQSHTYSIAEQTKRLVENSTAILQSVMNIETNTTDISTSMVDMRTDLRDVRATLSDIQRTGLRLTK